MSSDNSDSEYSIDSELSEVSSVEECDMEVEEEDGNLQAASSQIDKNLDACDLAYAFEPIADEDWLKQYEKKNKRRTKNSSKCWEKDLAARNKWILGKSLDQTADQVTLMQEVEMKF